MTKLRPAFSPNAALDAAIAALGLDELARVADRQPRTIRAWSDPDRPECVPISVALRVDQAMVAAGVGDPPFLTWYSTSLRACVADLPIGEAALSSCVSVSAREAGAAIALQIIAAGAAATSHDLIAAECETREAIAAMVATLHRLAGPLPAARA